MKKIISSVLLVLASVLLYAKETTAYKTGYAIGRFIGAWLPVLTIILIVYLVYRFFLKRKASH